MFAEDAEHGIDTGCTGKTGSIFADALNRGTLCVEVYKGKKVYGIKAEEQDLMVCGDPGHTSIPMLRTCFNVSDKPVKAARLYVTARGIYDCQVNGQEVTKTWFNPGETQYDRHIMYQTYNIDSMIHPGENALGAILASGWWSDAQTFVLGNYNYYGDRESLLGKIVISYEGRYKRCLCYRYKTLEIQPGRFL